MGSRLLEGDRGNEKAMGPWLGFLKLTEVSGRARAKEREPEWEWRNGQAGRNCLGFKSEQVRFRRGKPPNVAGYS